MALKQCAEIGFIYIGGLGQSRRGKKVQWRFTDCAMEES